MNINKNISVWSGSETPPTKYHLWIKNDGQYIFDGKDWVLSPVRILLYKDTVKISTSETQDIYYTYKEDVFEIDSSTDENIYKELTTDVPCTLYWSFYCLNSEQTSLSSSFNYEVRFYWNINLLNLWEWSDWISNYTPSLINKGDFETHVISVTKEMLDISKQNDERKDIGITLYEIRKKNTDTPITQLGQRFHIVGRKYYNDLSILYDYIDSKINSVNDKINVVNDNINGKLNEVKSNITNINNEINTLREEVDNKFTESSEEIEQTYIKKTEKGSANGVAPLDSKGLIPNNHLPSYVDDVIEVYASFDKSSSGVLENIQLYLDELKTQSVTGERGKIYIDLLTNYQFRWSGTIFTPISIPDSSIVDLGLFESETAADNVMLADNTGVIFNSLCLIITYKIGEQRVIIINQYNTERSVQHKYFNGRKYFRFINHNDTTVTKVLPWQNNNAVNLKYNRSTRVLSHTNRYGEGVGNSIELPLVTSTTDGLMSKEDKKSLTNNAEKITSIWEGDLPFNNTLSLNGTWTIYDQNDSFVEQRPLPISGNNEVEFGYKAEYSGAWKWILKDGNKPATETNGAWETELPSSGDWSKTRTFDSVTTTKTYTLSIYAYKRGLVVSGSNVIPASTIGSKDSRSISTSITFKHRLYYGAVTSNTPSGEDIKALTSKLVSTRANSITNITVPKEKYYCIAYPTNLGELKYITQNGSSPILSAFNLLKNIEITNGAGKKIKLYVYVSVRKGPFTNDNLTLE